VTMDQGKHDKPQDKQQENQRRMAQDRNRDMGSQRNEEETGKPVQLDKDGKENQGGQQHDGHQHQGGQPRRPETERKPEPAPAQR
jgi:hypothetical protein